MLSDALLLHFARFYAHFLHGWTGSVRPCAHLLCSSCEFLFAKITSPGGVLISPSFWAPLSTSTDHLRGMNQLDSNMSRESSSPILVASSDLTIPVLTSSAMLGNLKKRIYYLWYKLSGVDCPRWKGLSSERIICTQICMNMLFLLKKIDHIWWDNLTLFEKLPFP